MSPVYVVCLTTIYVVGKIRRMSLLEIKRVLLFPICIQQNARHAEQTQGSTITKRENNTITTVQYN